VRKRNSDTVHQYLRKKQIKQKGGIKSLTVNKVYLADYTNIDQLKSPLLDSHGNSFFQGVRFSVHTFSPGKVPDLKWLEAELLFNPRGLMPLG
jgi:hypothetical protein